MIKGDIVICKNIKPFPANEIAPELEENKEYTLNFVYQCVCKEEHFDIGLEMKVNYVECYKCREKLPSFTHWAHSSRFIKK